MSFDVRPTLWAFCTASLLLGADALASSHTSSSAKAAGYDAPAQNQSPVEEYTTFQISDKWKLKVDGQYRARFIGDTNFDFVNERKQRSNISHRARLGAKGSYDNGLAIRILLQDVRIWGEEVGPPGLNTLQFRGNGLDFHEAYLEVPFLDKMFTFKLGRQEIWLDNHRLVGTVGWTQRARAFDGLRLLINSGDLKLTAFATKGIELDGRGGDGTIDPAKAGAPDPRYELDFFGLHGNYSFGKALKASLVFLADLFYETNERYTLGVFLTGGLSGLSYTGEFYYQLGTLGDEDVSAYLWAVLVGYGTKVGSMKLGFKVFCDWVSGDGTPQGTFATTYATNHKFYGEMDFFLNTVAHTNNLGLMDVGGAVWVQAGPVHFSVTPHHFRGIDDLGDAWGTEIDVKAKIKMLELLSLNILYGVFLPDDLMTARFGGGDKAEHFGYITADLKF